LSPRDAAFAACDPAAASNVTATCTGTTVNQGGGAPGTSAGSDGYGTGVQTNLNVTVVPGASVTGWARGISFNTGSVANSGTISAGTGGALGLQRVGGNNVNAVLLGQAIPFATLGKDDVWGGFGGLGMEFRHSARPSISR
jgi:hypothetical protein